METLPKDYIWATATGLRYVYPRSKRRVSDAVPAEISLGNAGPDAAHHVTLICEEMYFVGRASRDGEIAERIRERDEADAVLDALHDPIKATMAAVAAVAEAAADKRDLKPQITALLNAAAQLVESYE